MDDAAPKPSRRPRGPSSSDPLDIAMEAEASGEAPGGEVRALLRDQRRLIGWEIADRRAGFGLKILMGLAGLVAAAALGVMAWQAAHANGVILEPFTVPPALTADGVSGQVVASQVLDELARLRFESTSPGQARDFSNDWGRSLKVSIPATGVSLGDVQDALRQWLGHETHMTGEVYRTPSGIAVTARVPGRPGLKAEGPAEQLPALAQNLARQVYAETQPVRYAVWLAFHNRPDEALAIAQPIAMTGASLEDRIDAYGAMSLAYNAKANPTAAVAVARQGLQIAPDSTLLLDNVAINESNLGHNESSLAAYRELVRRLPKDRHVAPQWRGTEVAKEHIGMLTYDFPTALKAAQAVPQWPAQLRDEAVELDMFTAMIQARLHDIYGARARIAAPRYALPWEGARKENQLRQAGLIAAWMAEDWPEALRLSQEILALPAAFADPAHMGARAQLGLTKVMLGDVEGGRAVLDTAADDSDGMMIVKAQALAAIGERGEAERLLVMVERRTPSAGVAPYWRGRMRLDAGDAAGALGLFQDSNRRSPHWADPRERQGEALAALGKWAEAEKSYAEGEPFAPQWGRLHLKHGEALARLGKPAEAQAQYRLAAALYLTAPERAELAKVQGAH